MEFLISPLLPLEEERRLQALRPYQLFNTMQDETFSEFVRLVAQLFNVPIGIVAFVEEQDVSYTLNYGLGPELTRVSREQTLCAVALLREEVSVFDNLRELPCELVDPTLVAEYNLGFYAGVALRTREGYPIGVLCVLDQQPRLFSSVDSVLLERLAQVVMNLLDVRLHLLQQPTWNQELWENIYARIGPSVTRLETLAAIARWEEHKEGDEAQAYKTSSHEESLHIITVLNEEITKLHLSVPVA